jgi:hypothetical protein
MDEYFRMCIEDRLIKDDLPDEAEELLYDNDVVEVTVWVPSTMIDDLRMDTSIDSIDYIESLDDGEKILNKLYKLLVRN